MADAFSEPTHARAGLERAPWVIVAGGFHARGGMDKANAALAAHLLARGHAVHLVAHEVAEELSAHPLARAYLVPRPAGSILLGEQLLDRRGRAVARTVTARRTDARVVTNGGNCPWPDINWVHSVHHAWPTADGGAPLWFRGKNRLAQAVARRRERRALRAARVVVANSERTRRDLLTLLGLEAARVQTVYLGGDAARGAASRQERAEARARLGLGAAAAGRPLVAFAGALGHDQNKGFDTLWRAWRRLSARAAWDADLIVAGGGRGVAAWRERVEAAGLASRVRLLGFTERVTDVYDAADLLVSPARYEAYGLNVREAVSRGTPALVSGRAGVAEHYTADLSEMILEDPEDDGELAARLLRWRADVEGWRGRFAPLSATLRRRAWADMAAEFVQKSAECRVQSDELQDSGAG